MSDDRKCPKCGQKMLCYSEPSLSIWYCAQCDLAFSTMLLRPDALKELMRAKMGIVKKDSV
jgi:ribosomal protein L37AE/L43A